MAPCRGKNGKGCMVSDPEPAPSAPAVWQPIETAPKDGTPVLVWTSDVGKEGLTEFASVCSYHPDAGFCTHELMAATHWMPLPDPPEVTHG